MTAHLAVARFPQAAEADPLNPSESVAMAHCLEATEAINSLRALVGVHPGQRVAALVKPVNLAGEFAPEFETWRNYASVMAKADIAAALDDAANFHQGKVPSTVSWGE